MLERLAVVVALGILMTACGSIGPSTVVEDRAGYATSIGNSWKEQTLLNIVKLRYADMPTFLEVAQVVAGYQLQSTIGGSFSAGNFNAAMIGPLTATGTATASGTYTDRPTVVYSPLTGVDFLKRLMTPIPPSSVLFMLQAGYAAQRVMPITLDAINGIANGSYRRQREPDPRFERLVALISEAQLAGTVKIRIERGKQGAESAVVAFPPSKDPAAISRRREITKILGLKADQLELKVYYGAASSKPDELDMDTRSMLEIMLEFAAAVRVPETDVAEGNATPGMVSTQSPMRWGGPPIRILVGDTAPKDAFVAVPYDNRWYWIAKTDIESKSTFGVLMLLFSVAETGTKGPAPVVTIPANQ